MEFLRNNWYSIGGVLFIIIALWLVILNPELTTVKLLVVLNLMALFIHQFE